MNSPHDPHPARGVYLRLFTAVVALVAGAAALVIAILLVRSVL
jgi:hypothetical protein